MTEASPRIHPPGTPHYPKPFLMPATTGGVCEKNARMTSPKAGERFLTLSSATRYELTIAHSENNLPRNHDRASRRFSTITQSHLAMLN